MRALAALSLDATEPLVIEEVELDAPRPDEVLVRLVASGVCHTDLFIRELWPAGRWPMVFGHEGAGEVIEVGEAVTTVQAGDRVVLTYCHCGACLQCRSGHPAYCRDFHALNMSGCRPDGSTTMRRGDQPVFGSFFGQSSFATHAIATQSNVVRIDGDVDLTLAAPLGCGFQTGAGAILNVLRPVPGDTVAVFGAGGVGVAAIMAAAAAGARTIVAIEPVAERRALAARVGATDCVDPGAADPGQAVRDLTAGGVAYALDTTAIPVVIRSAVAALAPRGTLALVGASRSEVTLDPNELVVDGKTIVGVVEGDATPQDFIPRLLDLYARGAFPLDRVITRYPFADINRALADSIAGTTVKPVLVHPSGATTDRPET